MNSMFNLLRWLFDRQTKNCEEELNMRLTGPLPETTNVCLLRLVDPLEETDPQEEDMIQAMEGDDESNNG